MNLPNILTLSRFGFALILIVLLVQNSLLTNILALFVFIIASLTDFYDGFLAKRQGLISDFGKIMDPIADKVLMLSLFCVLAYVGMVAWWMVAIIAIREIAVTISRLNAMRQGLVLAAEKLGKIKTVTQITVISLMLLFLIAEQSAFCRSWFYSYEQSWRLLIQILMFITVILTVISGISYFRHKQEKMHAGA